MGVAGIAGELLGVRADGLSAVTVSIAGGAIVGVDISASAGKQPEIKTRRTSRSLTRCLPIATLFIVYSPWFKTRLQYPDLLPNQG